MTINCLPEMSVINFGAWLKRTLDDRGIDAQQLSAATGKHYAYLNRVINSGKTEKPIRPDQEVVQEIGDGLVRLKAIRDRGEAEVAAGYIPNGYTLTRSEASDDSRRVEYIPVEEGEAELFKFLRGRPPAMQARGVRVLKAMFAEDDEADRAEGRIGGRAE